MTCYQYASNEPVRHIDLDGLEAILPLLGTTNPILLGTSETPLLEGLTKAGGEIGGKLVETGNKTAEVGTKAAETTSKTPSTERLQAGRQTETEQLAKNGLEKNTESVTKIDPKTGKEGTTIPDAMKNAGKSSVEIKDVSKQSLTKQLRLQKEFSNDNGFRPELIINKGAELSGPLKNAGFDISTYSTLPAVQDATKMPIQQTVILIQTGNQKK